MAEKRIMLREKGENMVAMGIIWQDTMGTE